MSLRFDADFTDVNHELKRLQDGPDTDDLLRLERILVQLYQETQQVVHVQTGSLRGSGTIDSDYRDHTWTGDIAYGGASFGFVHDPVWYAGEEQARGGPHDFMAPTHGTDSEYIWAIHQWLAGN